MMTFKELFDSTVRYRKWSNFYPDVDGKLVDIIPNTTAKLITFRFRVKSVSKINEGYNVWLQFYNVEFSDHPLSSKSVKIIEKDTGKPLYFEKISLVNKSNRNFCRVRCGCADFRFRFAWEDKAVNALYGGVPKSYQRKPGSNRQPVNPQHIPGICQHIYACAKSIEHYFAR